MHLFRLCFFLFVVTGPLSPQPTLAAPAEENPRVLADRSLMNRIADKGNEVGSRASELITRSMDLLGVPYRSGGTSILNGLDCSGFVRTLYEQTAGLLLPRKASEQAAATEKIKKSELQPGDLVFFNTMRRTFSHVGIYVGNGKFIHAPRPGAAVRVEDMSTSYWAHRFDGARRVPNPETTNPETRSPELPD
jgi:cell wall-associated NlpC family hydrolase